MIFCFAESLMNLISIQTPREVFRVNHKDQGCEGIAADGLYVTVYGTSTEVCIQAFIGLPCLG